MKLKLLSFLLFAAIAVNSASAGLLIEPNLGFALGGSDGSTKKHTSIPMGIRSGVSFLGLAGGLSYTHASFDVGSSSHSSNEFGAFVSYDLPILLCVWAGYNFINKWEHDGSNYYDGKSTEVGVGFTGIPFIHLNLGYKMHNMDEKKVAGTVSGTSLKPKELVFSVSLPFVL